MLRISRMSDYSIVLLTALARQTDQPATARQLADRTGLGLPTVGKLLKALTARSLLVSTQGRHGGYRLARDAREITLADIIEAVDGPIAMTDCFRADQECGYEGACTARPHWQAINNALRTMLSGTTLSDLGGPVAAVPIWHPRGTGRTTDSKGAMAHG